jgi:hypothetical protein
MKQEAEMNAETDKKLKEDVDTLNSADSIDFSKFRRRSYKII